ncbi:MAG: HK97 gp10 family phage protein [Deltaproteobacteria bacterium]|nr:HK97 gp10 family phage protein [Deltaproteobacteria bacterium]
MQIEDLNKLEGLPEFLLLHFAKAGERKMKLLTPVDRGRLRSSIGYVQVGKDEIQIGSNVEYAPYILSDAKPYIIRVKRARALAWVVYPGKGSKKIRPDSDDAQGWRRLRKRGLAAYAKWVRHPGGRKVISRTAEWLAQQQDKIAASAIREFMKGVSTE